MFLLDTNVISELRKVHKADRRVAKWAEQGAPGDHFLSVVTVLEVQLGAMRLERRDPAQGSKLRSWIDDYVLRQFRGRIIPIDTNIAVACAALHVPDPRSERDAWIAATALVHDLTVVTRNTRDFESTGVRLLNPWDHS